MSQLTFQVSSMNKIILVLAVVLIGGVSHAQSISTSELTCAVSPLYEGGVDTLKTQFVLLGLNDVEDITQISISLIDSVDASNTEVVTEPAANLAQFRTESGKYEIVVGDYVTLAFDAVHISVFGASGETDSTTISIQ